MALRANCVWEVQTGGDDTNGGGFDSSETTGTDRSLATSPHVTFDGTTVKFTAAGAGLTVKIYGHTVSTADLGNVLNATGGTNVTAGRYSIDSVVTGAEGTQSWTLLGAANLCSGAVTDGAGKMGGCLATPGAAAAAATIDGHIVYVKSGTYTITTATPGAAGPVQFGSGIRVKMEGYSSTRGDRCSGSTRPILDWGAVAAPGGATYLFSYNNSDYQAFVSLHARGHDDGEGAKDYVCGFSSLWGITYNCIAENMDGTGGIGFNGNCISCFADTCTTGFQNGCFSFCRAIAVTTGFLLSVARSVAVNCIASSPPGGSALTDGFRSSQNDVQAINCTAYNCTDGFDIVTGGNTGVTITNCLAHTCTNGFRLVSGSQTGLINCAGYNNTNPVVNASNMDLGYVAISAGDPLVDLATGNGDYRPDATTGEGALLRAAGVGAYGQTDNRDIGAVQHTDPAGGGGTRAWASMG